MHYYPYPFTPRPAEHDDAGRFVAAGGGGRLIFPLVGLLCLAILPALLPF